MLSKMLCSLYNHQEPWKVAATLHNGTIYLQEIETEEKRRQEATMPPQQKATCYWGLKFEDYVTSKGELDVVEHLMMETLNKDTYLEGTRFNQLLILKTKENSSSLVYIPIVLHIILCIYIEENFPI